MKFTASFNLIYQQQKMNGRKFFFLLKTVLGLAVGVLLLYKILKNREEAIILVYHAHNLTYLEELNAAKVRMYDPLLITAIRENFLTPPLPRSVPYNLKIPYPDNIFKVMAEHIAYTLKYETNGFFVEARAFDGEMRSNTLFLERRFNWTGLLIEPDPINVAQIIEKKRKAWLSPSCLSNVTYPYVLAVTQELNTGERKSGPKKIGLTDVQCLPLFSLLLALNRTMVDYLSLSVKGDEESVLRTIPFKVLNIKTISLDYLYEQRGRDAMQSYMLNQGYDLYGSIVHPVNLSLTFVFINKKLSL